MMDDKELAAIARRFNEDYGCPKSLNDLSRAPWVLQLMKDAAALLKEVKFLRGGA